MANNLTSSPAPLSTTCKLSENCEFFRISSVRGLWCELIQKRPRLRSLPLPTCSRSPHHPEQVTELPWSPGFFSLGLSISLHCSKELGWNEKSIAKGDPLLGQISCFCLRAWRPWVGRPVWGTLPEPALGWQVQAVSTLLWCVWGGGWEREGLKEEEEEERLCRDPKAAPLLQARPYLKLSSPPSPRERGRSRELGVGEKETERGNQRKLQKSMAWNQRQPQQLQCDFDSPIITLN